MVEGDSVTDATARLSLNKPDNVRAIVGPLVINNGGFLAAVTDSLGRQKVGQISPGVSVIATSLVGNVMDINTETLGKLTLRGGIFIDGKNGSLTIVDTLNVIGFASISGNEGNTLALASTTPGAATQKINVGPGSKLVINTQLTGIGLEKTGVGTLVLNPLAGNNLHKATFVTQGTLIAQATVPGQTVIPGSLTIGNDPNGEVAQFSLSGTNEVIANTASVSVGNQGIFEMQGHAKETIGSLVVGHTGASTARVLLRDFALTVTGDTFVLESALVRANLGTLTFLGNATVDKATLEAEGGFIDLRKDLILNGGTMFSVLGGRILLTGNVIVGTRFGSEGTAEIGGDLELKAGGHDLTVTDNSPLVDILISARIHNGADKVANAATITKRGAGTALFTADNSYTGTTFVNEGTLAVDGQQPLSRAFVNATLAGHGTMGFVGMNGTGVINPGSVGEAAAILTLSSLSTITGRKLHFDINGTTPGTQFDQLKVVGGTVGTPVQIGVDTVLDLNVGFTAALGTSFKIIDNVDPRAVSGVFKDSLGNILNQGATLTANGQAFTISYVGGDGNDVVVTRNTAPAFKNRTLTPRINEGETATLTGTITEPDATDTFFLDVNWGDGTSQTYEIPPDASRNVSVNHKYVDDPIGHRNVFDVQLVWRDIHGGSNHAEMQIKVKNVAPTVSNFVVTVPSSGSRLFVTASGQFNDPGVQDAILLRVQWNVGGPWETYTFAPGTKDFQLTHHYTRAGYHRVTVTVADGDGGVFNRRQWIFVPIS